MKYEMYNNDRVEDDNILMLGVETI